MNPFDKFFIMELITEMINKKLQILKVFKYCFHLFIGGDFIRLRHSEN